MPRPATSRMAKKVYIANETFVANIDGLDKAFHQGKTRAREGDEVLERYPQWFDLLEDFDQFQSYE